METTKFPFQCQSYSVDVDDDNPHKAATICMNATHSNSRLLISPELPSSSSFSSLSLSSLSSLSCSNKSPTISSPFSSPQSQSQNLLSVLYRRHKRSFGWKVSWHDYDKVIDGTNSNSNSDTLSYSSPTSYTSITTTATSSISFLNLHKFPSLSVMLMAILAVLSPSPWSPVLMAEASTPCTHNTDHTMANCSHKQWDHVPWSLHSRINLLDLSGNSFPVLNNQSFFKYQSLKQLWLRNNMIHTIEVSAFYKLDYLSILDLSNNRLTKVPMAALKPVGHSLKDLNLAGNKLYTIPKDVFLTLRNLRQLDLSGNSIHQVDNGAFRGLTSLHVLKLRHNALTSLPYDAFNDFQGSELTKVQLYENRWMCDCRLRWLWKWFNATDPSVWSSHGYSMRCDAPAFIREQQLSEVSLVQLACEVQMRTSGSTRELPKGGNTTMLCKYLSEPEAPAVWRKNSVPIPVQPETADSENPAKPREAKASKFTLTTGHIVDDFGFTVSVSELRINHFEYADIAAYDCVVSNVRGEATTEYRLTLQGVDFNSVVKKEPAGHVADSKISTRSIIIAVAVVSGIIIIIVIIIVVSFSVNRVQRKRRQKRDTIQENIKQHFIKSEANSNGDPSGSPNGKAHKMQHIGNMDMDSTIEKSPNSAFKPPNHDGMDGGDMTDEVDHPGSNMYPFDAQGPPDNANMTYVSYGSELTDPSDFNQEGPSQHPHPSSGSSNHYSTLPYASNYRNGQATISTPGTSRYDMGPGSHAGSATPLLDRNTPLSVFGDPEEPVEDYAHFPVYDSVTKTLQRPTPTSSFNYHNNGDVGRMYETLPNRQTSVASYASSGNINGYGTANSNPSRSFGPPSSYNGSMPRTPGSIRSGIGGGDGSAFRAKSYEGEASPLADPYATYGGSIGSSNSHYYQPIPMRPIPHQQQPALPINYNNPPAVYSDYQDPCYPTTTPPPHRMTPNSKVSSMSVGNLGQYSPLPTSSPVTSSVGGGPSAGPRKPPRVYQSREYMELTPQDSNSSSDYITSSDAQNYSQNYGITPGTPV